MGTHVIVFNLISRFYIQRMCMRVCTRAVCIYMLCCGERSVKFINNNCHILRVNYELDIRS